MKKREIIAKGILNYIEKKTKFNYLEKKKSCEEAVEHDEFFIQLKDLCLKYNKHDIIKETKEELVRSLLEEYNKFLPYDITKIIEAAILNINKNELQAKTVEAWGDHYYNLYKNGTFN